MEYTPCFPYTSNYVRIVIIHFYYNDVHLWITVLLITLMQFYPHMAIMNWSWLDRYNNTSIDDISTTTTTIYITPSLSLWGLYIYMTSILVSFATTWRATTHLISLSYCIYTIVALILCFMLNCLVITSMTPLFKYIILNDLYI